MRNSSERGVKRIATVTDVDDPKNLGRIRARFIGFGPENNLTPWCYPDTPSAGPGFGFFFLPIVGVRVHVELTAEDRWVWTGYCWDAQNPKPATGSPTVRVLQTPVGHKLSFDESGNVEIEHENGAKVVLKANGDIEIMAEGDIKLNGASGRVVTTECIDPFTGASHPQGSATVKSKGIN